MSKLSKEKSSRLVRVLLVRAMGVMALYALYETATYALSAKPLIAFGLGMVDLILLFMGVFMTFGRITIEDSKKGKQSVDFTEGFDAGFSEGYDKAVEDAREAELLKSSGDSGLPSEVEG